MKKKNRPSLNPAGPALLLPLAVSLSRHKTVLRPRLCFPNGADDGTRSLRAEVRRVWGSSDISAGFVTASAAKSVLTPPIYRANSVFC